MTNNIFEEKESNVRSYCRNFPLKIKRAVNARLFDIDDKMYLDFFAGAGALNYGHNNPYIKSAILKYLSEDNIVHALDMYTVAKEEFFVTFTERILAPKKLDYKIMCCGSTGTNGVEAALKLARKNKKRMNVIAFSGAFHGMTLGSLALTSDAFARGGAGVPLSHVSFAPYGTQFGENYIKTLDYLEWMVKDDHSGIDKPAAIFLESVQAEGGVNVAPVEWLKGIRKICDAYDILMVCDDIQAGIGRTGSFFSFERARIIPDMVILSKSISGFGIPMSLLLMKPELDIFAPAEHNGTWRGNQLAFVGATAGVKYFIKHRLDKIVAEKERLVGQYLKSEISPMNDRLKIRGIGLIWGIDFGEINESYSKIAMQKCFEKNLVIERAGRNDSVLKLLPPLTIETEDLLGGLRIIKTVLGEIL